MFPDSTNLRSTTDKCVLTKASADNTTQGVCNVGNFMNKCNIYLKIKFQGSRARDYTLNKVYQCKVNKMN